MGLVNSCVRSAVVAIALLTAGLGFASGAKAAGWGPEIEVRGGAMTIPMESFMDDEGNATIISLSLFSADSLADLNMMRIEDGNARTVFSADISESIFDPFLPSTFSGMDADGRVSMAWSKCDCDNPSRILLAGLNPDGSMVNLEPFEVAAFSADTDVLSLALDVAPNGTTVVSAVVEDYDNGGTWVEVYRVNRAQNQAVRLTDGPKTGEGASLTDVSINDAGEVLVAWQTGDSEYPAEAIGVRAFDQTGPVGPEAVIETDANYDELGLSRVLVDNQGRGSVIFTGESADGNEAALRQVNLATGIPLGIEATLIVPLPPGATIHRRYVGLSGDNSIRLLYPALVEVEGEQTAETRSVAIDPQGTVGTDHLVSNTGGFSAPLALGLRQDGSGAALYIEVDEVIDPDDILDPTQLNLEIRFRSLDNEGGPNAPADVLGQSYTVLLGEGLGFGLGLTSGPESLAVWPVGVGQFLASQGIARIYDATPPVLAIRAPSRVIVGEETTFAATVHDRSPVTTTWSFGDGGSAAGHVVSHAFSRTGKYTVGLYGVDGSGNEARVAKEITVYADPDAGEDGGSAPDDGSRTPSARPDTRITRPPALRLHRRQAAVHFRSTQSDSTFECRVGRGPIAGSREARLRRAGRGGRGLVVQTRWRKCSSPLRLRGLHRAVYVVRVRAVSPTGLRDRSPAVTRFRVLRPQRPIQRAAR